MADLDVEKLQQTLEKITSTINKSARHTEQIPEIRKKVEDTSHKVIALDLKMEATTERVAAIETKVDRGHDCSQVDIIAQLKEGQREASQKIDTDTQKGFEQRAQIAAVVKDQSQTEADVADIKKAPQRVFYGLVGIVITIVVGAGGAIWFLAELSKDVEHEQELRVEQFKRIESEIKAVGAKSDTAPVKRALAALERELEISNGHEQMYNDLCRDMSRHEKRFMKTALQRRGKSVPLSCME